MATTHKTLSSTSSTVKFLCSYGGKILLRHSDGRLRYSGGHNRVISVRYFVTFSELMTKLDDLCGYSVSLRCQLPSEDLDVLVSIKSDEDLANLFEVYDKASSMAGKELKIRAILFPTKSSVSSSSSSSSSSGVSFSSSNSDRFRSRVTVNISRFPATKSRYGVVRDCCNCYYSCHLQANSWPSSNLFKQFNYWH